MVPKRRPFEFAVTLILLHYYLGVDKQLRLTV